MITQTKIELILQLKDQIEKLIRIIDLYDPPPADSFGLLSDIQEFDSDFILKQKKQQQKYLEQSFKAEDAIMINIINNYLNTK